MAGSAIEESGIGSSLEGISSGQPGVQSAEASAEALAEWRSLEQVENGTPSTSPPYWETDDDICGGPKPSELYGKYTWKIDKFSQINKRELRSNAFDVCGYKWYILIYPQGCDVCNHLSLFLCVANHDKLLPGWSHFAQFTIAIVNTDPKKSKYSDTLHRFWKKEHDWGWKKFMELSKVLDGFVEADTLVIKAQVQVIRERVDRPFRCLGCQYRRELVRVYLSNVEQICRRFVEERRFKLGKLLGDKARWSSFCAFWLGIDKNARYRMSREKTDMILKVIVKHFFIEKEVTSTLVMDSLYSGLKTLEGPTKSNKLRIKLLDAEEIVVPLVRVEKDTFVLVDDVLPLLERAVMEPLPPKDEKGPQNRIKDGDCGDDFNKESIERDEKRLTDLGRKTIEIFVLIHMFSKIEVAYQEAVALKRQEELIREEEEAWMAETELKAKRGATEKEKKSKKKGKQKRNNRKGKDKGRDGKKDVTVQDMLQPESFNDDEKDFFVEPVAPVPENPDAQESLTDVSDSVDRVPDMLRPGSNDRDASPVNSDTDTSEVHPPTEASNSELSGVLSAQNGAGERKSLSIVDDSSSTCSTDSVPSAVINERYKGNSVPDKTKKSPNRGRTRRGKETCEGTAWANETHIQPSDGVPDNRKVHDLSGSCKLAESESEPGAPNLKDQTKIFQRTLVKKEEQVVSLPRKLSIKDQTNVERSKTKSVPPLSSLNVTKITPASASSQLRLASKSGPATVPASVTKLPSKIPQHTDKGAVVSANSHEITALGKFSTQKKAASLKPDEKPSQQQQVHAMSSRPSSAPLTSSRATPPFVSILPSTQLLGRSEGAAGAPSTHNYVPPQSYRNAILGNSVSAPPSPASISTPIRPSISFGMLNPQRPEERPQGNPSTSLNDVQNFDIHKPLGPRAHHPNVSTELAASACTSGREIQGLGDDEFPHLDIINDLLDDEHGVVVGSRRAATPIFSNNGPLFLNRQFSFPGDDCRIERARSYQQDVGGGFHGCYGGPFESLREMMIVPPAGPQQIDWTTMNQWQIGGSDLSMRQIMESGDGGGYLYQIPQYSDTTAPCSSVSSYSIFRPTNGH